MFIGKLHGRHDTYDVYLEDAVYELLVEALSRRRARKQRAPESRSAAFLTFWALYPNQAGGPKRAWEKWWEHVEQAGTDVATVMSALERHKQLDQWRKENGAFVPHAATWIGQRRWEGSVQRKVYTQDEEI
jgi:hypothetical protein